MVEKCELLGSYRQWYVCLTKSPEEHAFQFEISGKRFSAPFWLENSQQPGAASINLFASYVSGDESFSDCYQVTWSGTFKRFAGIIKNRTILLGM